MQLTFIDQINDQIRNDFLIRVGLQMINRESSDNIIMLCSKIFAPSKSLIFRNISSIYIYLRDHNKAINPPETQLKLSYNHPKNLAANAPKHQFINFKLDPEMEELLQRQIFQEYKNKVLRGIIDEQIVEEADPLWGEGPIPVHHYANLSKNDLMAVSYPQRLDIENSLNQTYGQYFKSSISEEITIDLIHSCKQEDLIAISLKARNNNIEDGRIWFAIEQRIDRGKKLNLFTHTDLIKLKYSFDGHRKYGTPIFHQILSSLIKQDMPKMNKVELIHLFYACRHSNPGITNVQFQVLQHLNKFYSSFTFQQKSDFLLALALCNKPIKFENPVHLRRKYEFKQLASSVVFKLNFWDLELSDSNVRKIIFSLAKLRLSRTKFITLPILDFINQNFDTFTANRDNLFIATVYLPELENGFGIANQQFFIRLRAVVLSKWEEFNKIEQIRLIYTFWNYGLMNQQVTGLYKNIEFEANSTLLYYVCQIELQRSSQRQWQVIQLAVQLQVIPLPYFSAFKRFYNYIKSTTQWNLTPLEEKLKNTEYYHNAMRLKDSMEEVKIYTDLKNFQKFSEVSVSTPESPIQNLQLAHFAYPLHQVSMDIVTKKSFIPGTQKLKQSYLNKARSLSCIGWKHIAFSEQQLKGLSLMDYIANINNAYLPYVDSQKQIIQKQDQKESQRVEMNKILRIVGEFDTKLLNKFMAGQDENMSEDEEDNQVDRITGKININRKEKMLEKQNEKKKKQKQK